MSLIVEDGTSLPNAESFITVAEATTYLNNRNMGDDWDAVDNKEAALRKATNYIQSTYKLRWLGSKTKYTQSLDWPRMSVPIPDTYTGAYYPQTAIPIEVKNACSELAFRAGTGDDLVQDVGRMTKSETVGPISVTYLDGASPQVYFASVDAMLKPLLRGSGSSIPIARS